MGIFGKRNPFKNLIERTNGHFWPLQLGDLNVLRVAGSFSERSHMCNVYILDKKKLSKPFTQFLKSAIAEYSKTYPYKKESSPSEKFELSGYPLNYFDFNVEQRETDLDDRYDHVNRKLIARKQFHVSVLYSSQDLNELHFIENESTFQLAINLNLKSGSDLEFALWNMCSEFPQILTAIKLRIEFEKGKPDIDSVKLVLPYSPGVTRYGLILKELGFK